MRLPILLTLATGLLAAACTSSPPTTADAATCDKTTADAVNKRNAKRALTWFASPVTRWSQIDDGVNACMHAKGLAVTRPCTDEELRRGNQNPALVVTARGISCQDPGRPS